MNKILLSLGSLLMVTSVNSFADVLFYETNPTFEHTDKGNLLVGHEKLGLYTFRKDLKSPMKPQCTTATDKGPLGSCLARWPAAVVKQENVEDIMASDSNFGIVFNKDIQMLQLTYFDLPVYYWFKDSSEKNFTGDGVQNAWSLIVQGKKPVMFNGLNK
ncbi:conserved hypothetical protein [Photobacterium leiognathi lrivu.4.1]|uniref:Uncharacterized protein n=1 Tax=Photobacterium leiognathi lrivu.4.1 TaxID=1248232 RepID=V5F5F9_PHOLE|nr:hypothetical protein [Photobacterium leiognathi]GAD28646.1 conserved hypothetical protein [Photobacterium leiognathi lrivu.4.1]